MRAVAEPTEIPLSEAAFSLKAPWRSCYDWLLSGRLSGRKVNGRWMVDASSVERVRRERETPAPTAA